MEREKNLRQIKKDVHDGLKKIKEAKEAYAAQHKATIKKIGSLLLQMHPITDAHAIQWVQYTPGFNDGDPCQFGVYDWWVIPERTSEGEPIPMGYAEDDALSKILYGGYNKGKGYTKSINPAWDETKEEAYNEVKDLFSKLLYGDEDTMKHTLGDGVCVRVTRRDLIVEDYYCGY